MHEATFNVTRLYIESLPVDTTRPHSPEGHFRIHFLPPESLSAIDTVHSQETFLTERNA